MTSEKKPEPGWYTDRRWPDEQRRWDGQAWLDDWRPLPQTIGQRPEGWMLVGALLAIGLGLLCGVAFTIDEGFGRWSIWVSGGAVGVVLNVGLIAKAVEVGIRSARSRG